MAVDDAIASIESAATLAKRPWVGKRDAALLTLLYGCGLRIGEALGLRRRDMPFGETLRVVGKGQKERLVPVLPPMTQLGHAPRRPTRSADDAPIYGTVSV